MTDILNRLDLTTKDIELIEAALQTQKKILSVQSEAGRTGAQQKLRDLKHLAHRVSHAKLPRKRAARFSWSQLVRALYFNPGNCGRMP